MKSPDEHLVLLLGKLPDAGISVTPGLEKHYLQLGRRETCISKSIIKIELEKVPNFIGRRIL